MAHQFSMAPQAKIPRASFNRNHGLKTTLDSGLLVPILVDEVLPGDTHICRASLFGRLATPLKPFFDNIFMDTFFFFVPNRLVWDNWERFNGAQDNPADSTDYTIPEMTPVSTGGYPAESLFDYMGIPTGIEGISFNALPFRCYNLIFNEWFRDQNLQDSIPVFTDDGPDLIGSNYAVRRRGKRHDYFTSCLPWPQKGEAVTVPLAETAPVLTTDNAAAANDFRVGRLADPTQYQGLQYSGTPGIEWTAPSTADPRQDLVADLSVATGVSINTLRQSFQIQKLLERDARGGTRYTELVRSHFGVTSPDARLQRPEFLGGGTSMVNINPVQQTGATGTDQTIISTPQGNLAAYGTVSGQGHGFSKSFTEHGWIIGLVNFRADLSYQQGLERMFSRSGRYDFYWPALAHIGEQAVLNKEIYTQGTAAPGIDDQVFGYQERYAEYRYKPSKITGKFRSTDAASLDVWHLAQEFSSLPVLGDTFIQDTPPIDRVVAVQDKPEFLLDVYFNYKSVRPMPMYGVPGLIDHF